MELSRMHFKSFKATVTLIAAATIAACGSPTPAPAPGNTDSSAPVSTTAHIAGCLLKAPGPSDVDAAFGYVPGFTVEQICPSDVDPSLPAKSTEFQATNAGKVVQNGSPLLAVFAGELKQGDGDAFVHAFLGDVGARVAPAKTVATEPKDVGGYAVTYFNVPADVQGYLYFKGPTVVVAYDLAGGDEAGAAEQALSTILGNLFTSP
jgi:hypothetical protein